MNKRQVDAIIKQNLPRLLDKYGLNDWEVHVSYRRVADGDFLAIVQVDEPYKRAYVIFNTAFFRKYTSDADVLEVLEHELQHILLHPVEALRSLVLDALGGNKVALRVVDAEFDRTAERLRTIIGLLTKRFSNGG